MSFSKSLINIIIETDRNIKVKLSSSGAQFEKVRYIF